MLSIFKEKLLSVQEEITSSLKGGDRRKASRRDYNAGASLLARYQKSWEDIHGLSEANAKQARIIDKQIEECHNHVRRERQVIRRFNSDVSDLSNIITLTEKAVNAIGNIRCLIDEVQDKIVELEDLIERDEHTNRIARETERLAEYRKEKLISLDALRERLSEDYDEKVKQLEREKEEIKKKNFEIAEKKFLQDLNAYKQTGSLPRREPVQPTMSIEEVEIDQDLDSLQEYLQT